MTGQGLVSHDGQQIPGKGGVGREQQRRGEVLGKGGQQHKLPSGWRIQRKKLISQLDQ